MEKTSLPRDTKSPASGEQIQSSGENSMHPPQMKLTAGAAADAGKPVQKKDDPLKVKEGQVTFDAEGQDSGAYFSRVCHWPGGNSGVTIGRGYDLGSRTAKGVLANLKSAGITGAQATTLSTGAGLKGQAAGDWVKANKKSVGEISHDQQKLLFSQVYAELKENVVDISEKKATKDKYGDVDFDHLHPAIMEILVDLRYRGDYHPKSREWIQPIVVKNDLKGFAAAMGDAKWKTDFGVPKDRFDRRKAFMQAALDGKTAPKPSEVPATKEEPKKDAPAAAGPNGNDNHDVIDNGTVSASTLNVRSGAGASFAKTGNPLTDGTKVQVFEKKDGWLRIGNGQWVSGEFVKLTGKGGETKDTGKPTVDPAGQPLAAGTVTAAQLNVRDTPNTDGKVVDTLKSGAKVTIMAEANGWMNIGPGRWISGKFVTKGTGAAPKVTDKPAAGGAAGAMVVPNWISIAEGEKGTAEIKGAKHNPRVLEYHSTTGNFKDDETPWCSSFANWVMKEAGQPRTKSASALSWAKYGKKLDKPAYGCIVAFDHGGGKGHVGFVVGMSGGKLQVLGGNQGDQVKVSNFGTSEVAGYRVPTDWEVPAANYTMGAIAKVEDNGGHAATR
jgi:uncharacterized protein (TIGR02594 family)